VYHMVLCNTPPVARHSSERVQQPLQHTSRERGRLAVLQRHSPPASPAVANARWEKRVGTAAVGPEADLQGAEPDGGFADELQLWLAGSSSIASSAPRIWLLLQPDERRRYQEQSYDHVFNGFI
jgi:hypothetical protein